MNNQQSIRPTDWGIYGGSQTPSSNYSGNAAEVIIFTESSTQPPTPIGGTFNFVAGVFTPPPGWQLVPPPSPTYSVWVSTAIVTPTQAAITWNTPGTFPNSGGGGGGGTVTQVFGTVGDINAAPATANASNYTLDLANVTRTDSTGTATQNAITSVVTDAKGRVTSVVSSPITTAGGTVTQVTATAGDLIATPSVSGATQYNLALAGVTRNDTAGTVSVSAITAVNTDGKGRVTGVVVSPIATGAGTVTNVSVLAPLSSALTFLTPTTTPQLSITGATDPTNQFLRADGIWFIPRGMGTIVGVDNVNFPNQTVQFTDSVSATATDAGSLFTVQLSNQIVNTPYLWSVENLKQFKQINFTGTGVTTSVDANGKMTVTITGGGGGGGAFSMVSAIWTTANSATKNAYSNQPTINNDGISITLTASSNPGTITTCRVSLNGTQLANTYNINGTFPNYTVTIPVADLTGNAAEIAPTVSVLVVIGTQFNLTANNLINTQPIPFTTTLTVNYVQATVPYFNQIADVAWSYSNAAQITSFGGNVTLNAIARNLTAGSGTLSAVPSTGGPIGGSAVGFGLNGAPSNVTVNFGGNLAALPVFIPAFYAGASTGATPPTFSSANSFTNGDPIGKTITFTQATATTQYIWVATQYPSSRIYLVTALGNATVTPNVIGPQQTISGQLMNIFGYTGLAITAPVQFIFV